MSTILPCLKKNGFTCKARFKRRISQVLNLMKLSENNIIAAAIT